MHAHWHICYLQLLKEGTVNQRAHQALLPPLVRRPDCFDVVICSRCRDTKAMMELADRSSHKSLEHNILLASNYYKIMIISVLNQIG